MHSHQKRHSVTVRLFFTGITTLLLSTVTQNTPAQMQNYQSAAPQQTISASTTLQTQNQNNPTAGQSQKNPSATANTGNAATDDNLLDDDFDIGADNNVYRSFIYQTQGANYSAEVVGYSYTYHRNAPSHKVVNWTIKNDLAKMEAAAGFPPRGRHNPIRVDGTSTINIHGRPYTRITRTINNKGIMIFVYSFNMQVFVIHATVTSDSLDVRDTQLPLLVNKIDVLCDQC